MNTRTVVLIAALLTLLCCTTQVQAQSPSGLLTGPVTYTGTLTQNPYGDATVFTKSDGTQCSVVSSPSCYIVKYVVGTAYNLAASDGTGNCYSWDVSQMLLGPCQNSFQGGAPGETTVGLYCSNTVSSDVNGTYNLTCSAGFDGTAVTNINGVNTPIPTIFSIAVTIQHHTVSVWIPAHFRTPRHLETWQQIDSMSVTVTPPSGS